VRLSYATIRYPSHGFTLIELLVVAAVAGVLLAGFTAFYLSQQRAVRHHQIEIETSQELRTALEQISRDLRSARKDITYDFNASPPPTPVPVGRPTFVTADTSNVEFTLDANDNGVVDADGTGPNLIGLLEHKGYRWNGSTLEQYDASVNANNWVSLAENVSAFTLTYRDCTQAILAAPVASPNNIKSIDILITVSRPVIGGLPVLRTESESVQLRNVRCP
jgi:prepilin-type N-terminal cleavage/methylation domain-containing protein